MASSAASFVRRDAVASAVAATRARRAVCRTSVESSAATHTRIRLLEGPPTPGGRDERDARIAAAALEDLAVDDLDAEHLPRRQARSRTMLAPQPQRERGGIAAIGCFFPVPNLDPIGAVAAGEQER